MKTQAHSLCLPAASIEADTATDMSIYCVRKGRVGEAAMGRDTARAGVCAYRFRRGRPDRHIVLTMTG